MMQERNGVQKKMQEFGFTEDKRDGDTYYFTLKGRVSVNESLYMEQELKKAVQQGCTHIIINMCRVTVFPSAAIRVILAMYQKLKNMSGTLQIENPSENVQNVIGMTALEELLLK
ncbi:MAG: STAS domain-containing protein [Oscillospiraceae bacterium]|nr:STAS domain-containing protein [Oscillospiraceae bacterium]